MKVVVDELGRIVLRKKLREKYGETFIVVESDRGILLRPCKKDPFEGIEGIEEKLGKYSLDELKKMGEKQAKKEIEEKLRGLGK